MLIIAPDKETAEELGGTDALFHSQFLREELEFLIPAKGATSTVLKEGNENSGDKPGHPFRGNQYTTGQEHAEQFTTQYHGTSTVALRSILKNGIRPQRDVSTVTSGSWGVVFMHPEKKTAERYARNAAYMWMENLSGSISSWDDISEEAKRVKPVIFEISVDPDDAEKRGIRTDPRTGGYMLSDIPPEWIKGYYVYSFDPKTGAIKLDAHHTVKGAAVRTFFVPVLITDSTAAKGGPGSGDLPGHPFRGNQYTDGYGGGEFEAARAQLSARARRAIESHVPATIRMRRGAFSIQEKIAEAIPGGRNIPGTKPFDIHVGPEGAVRHLIEVKSIWKAKHDKVTVHPPALRKKREVMDQNPNAKPSMIIVDRREKPGKVYYREGVGSFRFGGMVLLGEEREGIVDFGVLKKLQVIYGGKK